MDPVSFRSRRRRRRRRRRQRWYRRQHQGPYRRGSFDIDQLSDSWRSNLHLATTTTDGSNKHRQSVDRTPCVELGFLRHHLDFFRLFCALGGIGTVEIVGLEGARRVGNGCPSGDGDVGGEDRKGALRENRTDRSVFALGLTDARILAPRRTYACMRVYASPSNQPLSVEDLFDGLSSLPGSAENAVALVVGRWTVVVKSLKKFNHGRDFFFIYICGKRERWAACPPRPWLSWVLFLFCGGKKTELNTSTCGEWRDRFVKRTSRFCVPLLPGGACRLHACRETVSGTRNTKESSRGLFVFRETSIHGMSFGHESSSCRIICCTAWTYSLGHHALLFPRVSCTYEQFSQVVLVAVDPHRRTTVLEHFAGAPFRCSWSMVVLNIIMVFRLSFGNASYDKVLQMLCNTKYDHRFECKIPYRNCLVPQLVMFYQSSGLGIVYAAAAAYSLPIFLVRLLLLYVNFAGSRPQCCLVTAPSLHKIVSSTNWVLG